MAPTSADARWRTAFITMMWWYCSRLITLFHLSALANLDVFWIIMKKLPDLHLHCKTVIWYFVSLLQCYPRILSGICPTRFSSFMTGLRHSSCSLAMEEAGTALWDLCWTRTLKSSLHTNPTFWETWNPSKIQNGLCMCKNICYSTGYTRTLNLMQCSVAMQKLPSSAQAKVSTRTSTMYQDNGRVHTGMYWGWVVLRVLISWPSVYLCSVWCVCIRGCICIIWYLYLYRSLSCRWPCTYFYLCFRVCIYLGVRVRVRVSIGVCVCVSIGDRVRIRGCGRVRDGRGRGVVFSCGRVLGRVHGGVTRGNLK